VSNIYAQEDNIGIDMSGGYQESVEAVNRGHGVEDPEEYNSARSQIINVQSGVSNALLVVVPQVSKDYQGMLDSDTLSPMSKKGIFGMVDEGVQQMYYNQPQVNVYAHLAEEWIPGYETSQVSLYAQGAEEYKSGYQELMAINLNEMWSISRNIVYVFFVIVMIIIGFMIMFRSKLGGQTLVTLGNTLPNVVLALIGVTFSFAIAGLIIDIGGVLMVVLVDIITEFTGNENVVTLNTYAAIVRTMNFTPILADLTGAFGVFGDVGGFGSFIKAVVEFIAPLGQSLGSLIIALILFLVGLFGAFLVFINLIKAYLTLIFQVIIGPFQIALSAIPGKGVAFINWIKSLLRTVLIYPITFAILNFPLALYSLSDGDLNIPGPNKLTLGTHQTVQEAVYGFFDISFINGLTVFLVEFIAIFIAAKADKYAAAIVPPTTSREGSAAAQEAKAAIGKIPLLGSLLVKK
jgi:hypothetical protein